MPSIERTCKISGKKFFVSEQEQELRKKFDVGLPDMHPYERMRHLMCFRNIYTLYNDICDLCKNPILSIWGENPSFPVYCKDCWYSDNWETTVMDLDLDRPFFDQWKELSERQPHPARTLVEPIINSEYSNAATGIKDTYMSFNIQFSEGCLYVYNGKKLKEVIDTVNTEQAELLYGCSSCHKSYQVFWSEFALSCSNGYFLYDCADCHDCAFSTGLRHKAFVIMNEQLTEEAYRKKMAELKTGSYQHLQGYLKQFEELKAKYPKRYLIGERNEDVSGNIIYNSKNIEEGYWMENCENCVNVFTIWNEKDSLDRMAFGGTGAELVYRSAAVGSKANNVRWSYNCFADAYNLSYCSYVVAGSHDCFGCAFAKKRSFAILNKVYEPEEYKRLMTSLVEKMKERGEYDQMYRMDLVPYAYNETLAQVHFPLTEKEAISRGYRWVEKKALPVKSEQIYQAPDRIEDTKWQDLDEKVLICKESGRPYKITKQEFDFYQRFHIPLPRLHPEIRMFKRLPAPLTFQMHDTQCDSCKIMLESSMPKQDRVLCEACYQKKVT